jgi:N-acetylmuramoyl-L-alanine amidase
MRFAYLAPALREISDILCAVRNSNRLFAVLAPASVALAVLVWPALSSPQQTEPQSTPPQVPQQQVAPSSAPGGPVIVLDPAHGGTDTGARGENGVAEKDIALRIAQAVRDQLAQQGHRVLLTRSGDSDPSYDDRAAFANSHRDVVFVSIHISSTGTPGTVRAYFDQFASPIAAVTDPGARPAASANGLTAWEDAQRSYVDESHRLADLIQSELAQSFSGSPATSTAAPVRALRSVTAPAVAVEISSISGSTPDSLAAAAGPLASAISRAIASLRPANSAGAQ